MGTGADRTIAWYRGLSLRMELAGGFGAMIVLTLIVGSIALLAQARSTGTINRLVGVVYRIGDLSQGSSIAMLKARGAEKGFLIYQNEFGFQEARSRYSTLFRTSLAEVRHGMEELRGLSNEPELVRLTRAIDTAVNRYEAGFLGVVELYGRRGHVVTGLESKIREKAHEIEAQVTAARNDRLMVDLLTLRRREKDYFARGTSKDADAFGAGIDAFRSDLASARLASGITAGMNALASAYQDVFEQYVRNDARIDTESGLYLAAAHTIEPLLENLHANADREGYLTGSLAENAAQTAIWTIGGAVLLASLLGLTVGGLISRRITRSVDECLGFAGRVARGDLSTRLFPKGDTEFGTLAVALNRMSEGLEARESEHQRSELRINGLNRVYAVQSGINALIVRARDRDELFREACRIAVEDGRFAKAWVGLVGAGSKDLRIVASCGGDPQFFARLELLLREKIQQGRGAAARAIATLQPVVSNDMAGDPEVALKDDAIKGGARSLAMLPLLVSGEVVGVLSLNADVTGFFDAEEMKLLAELAGNISFAIDHIDKRERIDYLARYDELTGLANRALFLERLANLLGAAGSETRKFAVLVIDIERFRSINEALGRKGGDELLKQFTARVRSFMIDPNWLARIGGDQFASIVPDAASAETVRRIEQRMSEVLTAPFALEGLDARISAKIGIALFPTDGTDADTLLRNAEAALKKAKALGDRYMFYAPEMTARVAANLTLENRLREALEKEEFVLHYQPKVSLETGKVTSAEALIRWNDPRTGLVPPGHFIPILEQTGLILDAGRWALRKALEDYLRWRAAGLPAVRIAVNVSPLQLRNRDFIAEIAKAVGVHADAAAGLELEITESVIMHDIKKNIATLQAVREMGVTIAIDDFGTGFSSLSYLSKLPIDTLKIDRSFVVDMMAGPDGLSLVSTIISLARALKLKVVAEGVETQEQSNLLRLLSCDEMQGFLFSKAVPAADFEAEFLATPQTDAKVPA